MRSTLWQILVFALAGLAWGLDLLDPEAGHALTVAAWLPWLAVVALGALAALVPRDPLLAGGPASTWAVDGFPALVGCAVAVGLASMFGVSLVTLAPATLALPLLGRLRPLRLRRGFLHALVVVLLLLALLRQVPWMLAGSSSCAATLTVRPAAVVLRLAGNDSAEADGPILRTGGRELRVDAVKAGFVPLVLGVVTALGLRFVVPAADPAPGAWTMLAGVLAGAWFASLLCVLWWADTFTEARYAVPATALSLLWYVPLAAGALVLALSVAVGRAGTVMAPRPFWRDHVPPPPSLRRLAVFVLCMVVIGWTLEGGRLVTSMRRPTVLVDEIHSQWEPFYGRYGRDDEDRTFAENNYRSFLRWLSRRVDVQLLVPPDREVAGELEPGVRMVRRHRLDGILPGPDPAGTLLILKCVTEPLEPLEVDAVELFVRRGGSLLLIGEHTDGLFMCRNLDEVAGRFGMRFRRNSTYSLDGDWVVTTRNDVLRHPVVRFFDFFYWANGCTLELTPPARALVWSPWASFAEPARYQVLNFFGDKVLDPSDPVGRFPIMAEARVGEGRVLAFTDSTCFNNDLFHTWGRRSLLDGVLAWSGARELVVGPVVGLLFVVLACVLMRQRPGGSWWAAVLGLPALLLGSWLGTVLDDRGFVVPGLLRPERPAVVVDAGHDQRQAVLSEARLRHAADAVSLVTLVADLGRLPVAPRVSRSRPLRRAELADARLLVVPGSRAPWTEAELDLVAAFVADGGGLFVVEGAGSCGGINPLLARFGMEVTPGSIPLGKGTALVRPAPVLGGEPLLRVDGVPVVAQARSGRGLVLVLGDDALLGAENELRDELGVDRLVVDAAAALMAGDEARLRELPWQETLLEGKPWP